MSINSLSHKRIFLSSPTMHGEEQLYIKEAFDTNWIAPLGHNVDVFEQSMAQYIGCNAAAALTTGTAALHMAVKLAGVQPGDIVLCSDLTFSATVNPVSYEGGVQVFIDSEYDTWNMDPIALESAFQKYDGINHPKPKAVIVVNLYGTPAKLDEIKSICDKYNTVLIEDAAESLSAKYNGRQTGTFGKFNVISFNGNKIITTSGGGMLLSDDQEAIKKVRFWATQSRESKPYYHHKELGYNYRMSNIVAGIGRGQLLHLDEHKSIKQEIYERYKKGLKELPITLNPFLDNTEPNYWLSCLLIDSTCTMSPETIRLKLEENNIESRPIWKPMHLQPIYQNRDFITNVDSSKLNIINTENGADNSVGGDIFNRGLCLPSDIKMTEHDQQIIIDLIRHEFEGIK